VFRSHVLLSVGEPLHVGDWLAQYETDEHAAVDALTETIRARLDAVVLQAETRELLDGAVRVAHWTADASGASGSAGDDDPSRARELLEAYRSLRARDPERADAIVSQARTYARLLERLGVPDPWALEFERIRPVPAFGVVARLLALTPLAIVGAVLGWVPYRLAGRLAGRVAREEDVLGTVKLLAGALLLTVAWLLEGVGAGIAWGALAGVGVFVAGPATGYAALRWDELRALAIEALRHAAVRRLRPEVAMRIASRRRELARSIADALADAGVST
jgi:hypothetical protein